ncbi:DEAD/DEAH box helicase family protein (plasmid) [Streptomyces sp. NBC_01281]|uniref:DEAD/DEAH box helicase n=1 Tax=Streptomyces sp. NBC_01281 TaxID=2903811 RepID=UPI002E1126A4|nr:DEAD/DEAH box helicase family protein [Streptomyces sp. NBC_01281]WSK66621.1 DEAD/DEAH box helicase family protein [Streptomyces sp. NBC_01281]
MMRPTTRHSLRRDQRTALNTSVAAVTAGGRATVVMPCGCGKTLVAARTAEHLAHSGHVRRTVVMVPTLDLLVQTARVWKEQNDHHGRLIAVCSPRTDLDDLNIPQTTDPAELAAFLGGLDHYTVFATYASLADGEDKQGVLLAAHAARAIPAWDLVIADEAHRTSGSINKAWAAVHDDDKVPARRRLYYTATPRIWESDPAYTETLRPGGSGPRIAVSMDDPDIYGQIVYRMELSEAISAGLVCDYRIVMVVVEHPGLQHQLRRTRNATFQDSAALISLATALLKTAARYPGHADTSKWISFHQRVQDSQAFTDTFRETASALASEMTPGPQDDQDVPLVPATLRADTVHMDHPDRIPVLENLSSSQPLTDDGRPSFLTLVSNCRILGEGWDSTSVDVCFAAPRADVVGIVQALGRALRPRPDGSKATLLVPIYLAPGEDPEDLLNYRYYKPLYDVLLALRAHDRRISDRLPTTQLAEQKPAAPPVKSEAGGPTEDGENQGPVVELPEQQSSTPPFGDGPGGPEIVGPDGVVLTPREVAQVIKLHVTRPSGVSADWSIGAAGAADFHNEHGHLSPPRVLPGQGSDPRFLELPAWLDAQRAARRAGELKQWQIDFLDENGMVWEPRTETRQLLITYARECTREHGGLAVSSGYTTADGRKFGRDLNNLRQRADKYDTTAEPTSDDQKGFAELLDTLFEIDPWWNPPWPLVWQRHYQQASLRYSRDQNLAQPGDTRTYRQWLRDPGDNLTIDQLDLLRAIGYARTDS